MKTALALQPTIVSARLVLAAGSTAGYLLILAWSLSAPAPTIRALAILPPMIAGWLLGTGAGITTGMFLVSFHVLLIYVLRIPGAEAATISVLGNILMPLLGWSAGWVSSLVHRVKAQASMLEQERTMLREQIAERTQAEAALRQMHLDLEARVRERTSDLESANSLLETEIVERKHAQEELQHKLQWLDALRTIDLAITANLGPEAVLSVILEQARKQLHVDAASVLLFHEDTHTLEYAASLGFRTKSVLSANVPVGSSYAGHAVVECRLFSLDDLREREPQVDLKNMLKGEEFVDYYVAPLVVKDEVKGVLEVFHRSPLNRGQEWVDFLAALASHTAVAVDVALLVDELEHTNRQLSMAYDSTLEGWSRALDLRDKETEGHTQRVTEMTLALARQMGVSDADLVHIRRGTLLHDIGKMGIPDSILLKPGPLTDDEWTIMKKHPVYAHELLAPIEYLRPTLGIPYYHHEKWDGTGYPRGLKGKEIPLPARIFAVVDVYDALRSDRPYRAAWPEEKVREYIRSEAGKHFDSAVVDAFLNMDCDEISDTNHDFLTPGSQLLYTPPA